MITKGTGTLHRLEKEHSFDKSKSGTEAYGCRGTRLVNLVVQHRQNDRILEFKRMVYTSKSLDLDS